MYFRSNSFVVVFVEPKKMELVREDSFEVVQSEYTIANTSTLLQVPEKKLT